MSVPARAYLSIGEVLGKLRSDFPDVTISSDAESIALCIDCIRATFDTNSVSKAEMKLLMSPSTSDFWMDCAWEGVVAYAEGFCGLLK